MAVVDRRISSGQGRSRGGGGVTLMRRLQEHVPNSTQLMGISALVISGAILLLLTGLTVTATVLGLTLITPLIVLTSPIWVPVGVALLMGVGGLLSMCGFGVTVVAGLTWVYRYIRGSHPPGSQRIDYARSRLADTASHVRDYAWDYSGFLATRVKDAAPGA